VDSESSFDDPRSDDADDETEEENVVVDDAQPPPQPVEDDVLPYPAEEEVHPVPIVQAVRPTPNIVQQRAARFEQQTAQELRTRSGRIIKYTPPLDYVPTEYGRKKGSAKIAQTDVWEEDLPGAFKNEEVALMAASALIASNYSTNPNCPRTYKQAMARPDHHRWRAACDKEIASIKRFGVFEEVNKKTTVTQHTHPSNTVGARYQAQHHHQGRLG
jgi:hypothetical protein